MPIITADPLRARKSHDVPANRQRGGDIDPAGFIVVVHDATPCLMDRLRPVVSMVRRHVSRRFACAVVPDWHHRGDRITATQHDQFAEMIDCDEWLLHGLTHRCARAGGLLARLSGASNEFTRLSLHQTQARIDRSQHWIQQQYGRCLRGLVPPAWQLPHRASDLKRIDYVMRWSAIESCRSQRSCPMRTLSYDWGPVPGVGYGAAVACHAWACLSERLPTNVIPNRLAAVPCIAIHPADVSRGWLPAIEARIVRWLDSGLKPLVPRQVVAADVACQGQRNARHDAPCGNDPIGQEG